MELRSRDDVLKVEYVSEDDAWNSFKEEYFGDNPELADGFKDDNPLAGSSSYAVYMKPQEDKDSNMISKSKSLSATQKELVKFAEGLDGVRKVNKSDVVAEYTFQCQCTGWICVNRDHFDPVWSFDLPDQQYRNHGYYGS